MTPCPECFKFDPGPLCRWCLTTSPLGNQEGQTRLPTQASDLFQEESAEPRSVGPRLWSHLSLCVALLGNTKLFLVCVFSAVLGLCVELTS